MSDCEIQIRVPYADTDQMGMVYYANYLVYFERGRTEWLRSTGLTYRDLEARGIFLPVVEAHCGYGAPARYDDLITVRTGLAQIRGASIIFDYTIALADRVLCRGYTRHPFADHGMRPVRIPADLKEIFESRVRPRPEAAMGEGK